MVVKVEVMYFPKPCPHCKEQLFRVVKMSTAWSECRNRKCPHIMSQMLNSEFSEPYTECYNRR